MRNVGEQVTIQGKTYTISGYHKKSYLLKDERGKEYKCGPAKLERMICGIPRAVHRRTSAEMQLPNMSEQQIIERLRSIDCELSPENLSCDGEASASFVRRRYAQLNREKKALEAKLGRSLTYAELYGSR